MMTLSERVYRFLLRAYPARYRAHYAEPMACCFRDQVRSARTPLAFARLWLRTGFDLLWTIPARHFSHRVRLQTSHAVYSEAFRQSIFFARAEASSFGRREITVEHLLLGLLRQDERLRQELGPAAVTAMVQELERVEGTTRREPPLEDLPLSFAARRVLDVAKFYGLASEDRQVELRDLRRGILREEGSLAARLLREHGVGQASRPAQ
jgi:hypothetical protein